MAGKTLQTALSSCRSEGVDFRRHTDQSRRHPSGNHRPTSGDGHGTADAQREGIRLGDPVRIIRDPLFGQIGEVSALPPDLTKIPTESEVRVLEVKLSDGKQAVIPRTNIEVIEGA